LARRVPGAATSRGVASSRRGNISWIVTWVGVQEPPLRSADAARSAIVRRFNLNQPTSQARPRRCQTGRAGHRGQGGPARMMPRSSRRPPQRRLESADIARRSRLGSVGGWRLGFPSRGRGTVDVVALPLGHGWRVAGGSRARPMFAPRGRRRDASQRSRREVPRPRWDRALITSDHTEIGKAPLRADCATTRLNV
jgi:hypothetical protein